MPNISKFAGHSLSKQINHNLIYDVTIYHFNSWSEGPIPSAPVWRCKLTDEIVHSLLYSKQ